MGVLTYSCLAVSVPSVWDPGSGHSIHRCWETHHQNCSAGSSVDWCCPGTGKDCCLLWPLYRRGCVADPVSLGVDVDGAHPCRARVPNPA